jgi:hypothetical protein
MLLRLTSGLFALAFALLLAQVPGFFAEKQNQLNQRDALLIDKIAVFSETAASTGMALPQFVQSLQSHNDDAIRAQGIEIARTLENQTRVKESLEAFSAATPTSKLALLLLYHRTLNNLPLERDQLFQLPKDQESYSYGLFGFIVGIFFFSLLLFLGLSLKKLYKLRQARKLLASRGYG